MAEKQPPKPSALTSGKIALFQLTVAMPPGMSDEEAMEWVGDSVTVVAALLAHSPSVQIGITPVPGN